MKFGPIMLGRILAAFVLSVAFTCKDPAKLKLVPLDPDTYRPTPST